MSFLIRCFLSTSWCVFFASLSGSATAAAGAAAAGTKLSAAAPRGNHGELSMSPKAAEARSSPRLAELSDEELEALFEEFGIKFEKSYENDDEKAMRFEVFKRNLKRIDEVCCMACRVFGARRRGGAQDKCEKNCRVIIFFIPNRVLFGDGGCFYAQMQQSSIFLVVWSYICWLRFLVIRVQTVETPRACVCAKEQHIVGCARARCKVVRLIKCL